MELRYLRYFVAVAHERHFTKAAKSLGISQPPLSQQIKRLEEEVGTPLFRRLTRGVELTEAGEAFYEDACKILAMSDAALEKARGIARGLIGSLSIGITSSDAFHPHIFALIRQFQLQNPAVTVHQVEANMATLMTRLGEGELDLAFVRLPCESSKAFELKILDREPMVVALHRTHPLAGQPSLTLAQLNTTPVILFPQDVAPGLYDRVYGCCERAGIDMQHTLQSSQLSSSLSMVAAGGGFALVPQSMAAISPPDVTYHALTTPELYTDIALCWRRFERSRTVKRFLAMQA
ncbi:LysR family transcriptional regulator [Enterobacter sp. RHBSTW-00901]|uniref:LysR family transcriptional regulator n=1 Tax=Enterobacter sp. RHBSTW-00901 TaxID=2742669 RepID=UPI0015DC1967|nr:LysR family transcriptional regulator [Enterobacter sp. RHBSTW-00901]MBA7857143.1 LysR family transcriptional regulator [Enterobacter sp. RHBSTW-00901]BBS36159.1 LysR family transcriptional regulator [Enterobacter cloacae]